MQRDFTKNMLDAPQSVLRVFKSDPADNAMYFIAFA
jgi:hypothetical protein